MAKKHKAWFSNSGLNCKKMNQFCKIVTGQSQPIGVKMEAFVCSALSASGKERPSNVSSRDWIIRNAEFIISKLPRKPRSYTIKTAPGPCSVKKFAKPSGHIVEGVHVTSTEFLDTFAWRRLRMEAIKKYGRVCMCCGASKDTGAVINVDHVKPRKLFPDLALSIDNLQILCHECNHGKGNWDQTDWRPDEFDPEHVAHLRLIKSNG